MIEKTQVYRASDLIWRRIGDEVVIITPDGQTTHLLNRTAGFIWEIMDDSSVNDMVGKTCERFNVSAEEAHQDIESIIEKMLQLGIINQVT